MTCRATGHLSDSSADTFAEELSGRWTENRAQQRKMKRRLLCRKRGGKAFLEGPVSPNKEEEVTESVDG